MKEKNRVILITGASRGIGEQIFQVFKQKEPNSYVVGISRKGGPEIYSCDLSIKEDIEYTIMKIKNDYGNISVLVNNAGVVSNKPFLRLTYREWMRIININLHSVFLLSKLVVPNMIDIGGGHIINIGSIAGLDKSVTASTAYTTSKYGMVGLTKQLAYECAQYDIHINCVCPSQTYTQMLYDNVGMERIKYLEEQHPSKRLAYPDDIAQTVYFLSKTEYINGETIKVAGGL